MNDQDLPTTQIPERLRGFVYVVGMLGFPVVIATYVLVVLSSDLKAVDKSLAALSTRIAERPMGLEKSTDFAIYVCGALRDELKAGLPELTTSINFEIASASKESLSRTLTMAHRDLNAYVRPIVRKHQRFASRFPTVGGNLGSSFVLSAPGEDLSEGETEAHLRARASQEFSEALGAMFVNNISDFGNLSEETLAASSGGMTEVPPGIAALLGMPQDGPGEPTDSEGQELDPAAFPMAVVEPDLFLRLALGAVDTATTVLRDQMLQRMRLESSELEGESAAIGQTPANKPMKRTLNSAA